MESVIAVTSSGSGKSSYESALRPALGGAAWAASQYVGYRERPLGRIDRREVARSGLALILAFGDPLEVWNGLGGDPRNLRAFVIGNQSCASRTRLGGDQLGIQLELSPSGARALFGNVSALNNAVIPLDEALGQWGQRLVEQLGNAETWPERFDLLDHELAARCGDESRHRLRPEVAWLQHHLLGCSGRTRVEPLMDQTGWSRRTVTERFRHQLGVTPKTYARLLRFTRAAHLVRTMQAEMTLADLAAECGYYDQSHLTREFSALAGCTPGVLRAEVGPEPGFRFLQDEDSPVPLR